MFAKPDEEYLIRRLARNEVVLFLGAGFSIMAINGLGETLPTGKGFSKKIWEMLGYSDDYEKYNTHLSSMYQVLIDSGKPHSEIIELLENNFLVKSFPDVYYNITIPFWYKIYTVNIDDLIERIYKHEDDPKLQILKYPTDEYKERDQSLDYLQGIYLHGKLPCKPKEVIFSRTQYANSTLIHNPLYEQFVHEYSTLPTIFIGTALDEPIFDQYIAARQSRRSDIAENRPKCFLIDPYINPIQESLYRNTYNIEPVRATTEQFLNWLESIAVQLPNKIDTLKTTLPSLSHLLSLGTFKESYRENVNEFSESFSRVNINKTYKQTSKAFLLGTTPTWADIFFNLDAPRPITIGVYEFVESLFNKPDELFTVAVLGSPGSGKSTLLKRAAFALAKNGRSVYFSSSETIPTTTNLCRSLEMLNEKVVLVFDNAELILRRLVNMFDEFKKLKFPPIVVLASRTSEYDKITGRLDSFPKGEEFFMPNLERQEIISIINILDENNLLGYLKGMTGENRIREFEYRAKKQILVAMREATNGRDFDEIIKSEFRQIVPDEAKRLCLCVALATDAGFTVSKQDFVSFSSEEPATVLDYLERALRDIILKVGPKGDKLLLRHRVIASYILESCVKEQMLKQAYIMILSSLANEINNSNRNSRNPRKFALYREIINHYTIYRRFSKNIDQAREVYEKLATYFNDDFQFWLQYGALESEGYGGDLQLAENYLNQADSLNPNNLFVQNAIANLYYKKAIQTNNSVEAITNKGYADGILLSNMSDKGKDDIYTYYIYAKGSYEYALKWAMGDKSKLKQYLQDIYKITKQATDLYPNDKKLRELNEVIFTSVLKAQTEEGAPYPIIFTNEFLQSN